MKSFELAQKRSQILAAVRDFFVKENFLEVDTPQLVRLPGMEPYLDVFQTRFEPEKGHGRDMYLITSPEYALKRLLAEGYEKIFQMGHCFRNKETGGPLHNPEFTMIEWYRSHANYFDIMQDVERFLQFLVPGGNFEYKGVGIDVSKVERLKVREAFEKYADVPVHVFEDEKLLIEEARKRGYKAENFDDAFFLIFLNEIEQKLGIKHPTILYEYPASMASLSRLCPENPKYAERFELYIAGMEFANAFSELNDAKEQRKRLEQERKQRQELGRMDYEIDEKFLEAVGKMPSSSGIALGVDRLVMLLLGAESIEDVIFFPFSEL